MAATRTQAAQVAELAGDRPPIIALDGDDPGTEGTARWLTRICVEGRTPALITRLPAGQDPADWIREHGVDGPAAFDQSAVHVPAGSVGVATPGRELVQILLSKSGDQTGHVVDVLAALANALPPPRAGELLDLAVREMTRQGWNPNQRFSRALQRALEPSICTPPDRNAITRPHLEVRAPLAALPQL